MNCYLLAGSLVALTAAVHGATLNPPPTTSSLLYIGTYTGAKSQGIYAAQFDPGAGRLSAPTLVAVTANPSFLAVHPTRRWLYAVNEAAEPTVTAFAIESPAGPLRRLNAQPAGGSGPCHLIVDHAGQNVLVANYGGGSLAVLPVAADGRLAPATAFIQQHAATVNPARPAPAHAHGLALDAANRFVFCADLGLDQVLSYCFDSRHGTLQPNDPPAVALPPGAGPRHIVFHPAGRFAYVINEKDSTVTAFSYNAQRGTLAAVQTVTTVPADFTGKNYPSEIVVHPNGKFLYGANRRHDSLAVWAIAAATGQLTLVEHQATHGQTPRHFAIDPTGNYLLVANQDSDNIVVLRLDPTTGRLQATGQVTGVGAPACVVFAPSNLTN